MISPWTLVSLAGVGLSALGAHHNALVLKIIGLFLALLAVYGYLKSDAV